MLYVKFKILQYTLWFDIQPKLLIVCCIFRLKWNDADDPKIENFESTKAF